MAVDKDLIRSLTDSSQILDCLDNGNLEYFGSKEIDLLYSALRRSANEKDCKIAYGGNYTIEPLNRYVAAYAARFGILSDDYVMPFNQCMQEVMVPGSGFHEADADFIVFSFALEAMASGFFLPASDGERVINEVVKDISELLEKTLDAARGTILISDFPSPYNSSDLIQGRLDQLNSYIYNIAYQSRRVQCIKLSGLVRDTGWDQAYDARMYAVAKMMWTHQMNTLMALEIVKHLYAAMGLTKKCLVLDLDNTLWVGVVGEDGPGGILVGSSSNAGRYYADFQRSVSSLKDSGIVLAVCSKNNRSDVEEAFRIRSDMPLTLNDFVSVRINWKPKSENIREIADELNIGLNSLVFMDDNPVEVGEVKELVPEVAVILVPSDVSRLPGVIKNVPYFFKTAVTEEDRNKTILYQQNKQREQLKSSFSSLQDYLKSLNTEVVIRPAGENDIERVRQLFVKTNQFNLTTIRYDQDAILSFLKDNSYSLILIEVRDKYGDLGITGLSLVEYRDSSARIDSFILSCRVLGRNIESVFLNAVKEMCSKQENVASITAGYFLTAKNKQTENFYENEGFTCVHVAEDGKKFYELSVGKIVYKPVDHISIKEMDI